MSDEYDVGDDWCDYDARHTKNSLKFTELNLLFIREANKLLDTLNTDDKVIQRLPTEFILYNHWLCFDEKTIGKLIDSDYSIVVDRRCNPATIKIGFGYSSDYTSRWSRYIIIPATELYWCYRECFQKRCVLKKTVLESPFHQSLFNSDQEAKYESRFDPRDRKYRRFRNYYITYLDECKRARQYDYKKPEIKSELTTIQQFDLIETIRAETVRLISEHSNSNNTLTLPISPPVPEMVDGSGTIGDTEYCKCNLNQ